MKGYHSLCSWTAAVCAAGLLFAPANQASAQSAAPAAGTKRAPSSVSVNSNAAVSPGDLLEMTVFQEDDMTTRTRVAPNGTITIPLVGSVSVGGQSADEAAQTIRERLKKGYFRNPQVTVTVLEYSRRMITVIGQVQKGGTFDFPDGQTTIDLLTAIGMAGGYTRIAEPKNVTIKRVRGGREEAGRYDAKAIAAGKAQNVTIHPGDTIIVGESIF
jgi:protein involved in polysaccharide export with SLBB domain